MRNRRNDFTQGWEFCSLQHCLRKGREKKKKLLQHEVFVYLFTHQGTNADEHGSTLLSGRDVELSLCYSDSECILFLISKMRKGKKERKKITDLGVSLILHYCLGISDEGNSVSRTENFMNVFNGVTSPLVFSYS